MGRTATGEEGIASLMPLWEEEEEERRTSVI